MHTLGVGDKIECGDGGDKKKHTRRGDFTLPQSFSNSRAHGLISADGGHGGLPGCREIEVVLGFIKSPHPSPAQPSAAHR